MLELLESLEQSGFGRIARESLYGFQILVAIHILGLILSLGTLLWVDLRMLGLALAQQPLPAVYRSLSRWFVAGFGIMFVSGAMLFAGFATSAYENVYFRIKITLIVLAGINAVAFHAIVQKAPAQSVPGTASSRIRLAGFLSILFWGAVVICGRMMSYTLF